MICPYQTKPQDEWNDEDYDDYWRDLVADEEAREYFNALAIEAQETEAMKE